MQALSRKNRVMVYGTIAYFCGAMAVAPQLWLNALAVAGMCLLGWYASDVAA